MFEWLACFCCCGLLISACLNCLEDRDKKIVERVRSEIERTENISLRTELRDTRVELERTNRRLSDLELKRRIERHSSMEGKVVSSL